MGYAKTWFEAGPSDIKYWEFEVDGARLALAWSESTRDLYLLKATPNGGCFPLAIIGFNTPREPEPDVLAAGKMIVGGLIEAARRDLVRIGEGHWDSDQIRPEKDLVRGHVGMEEDQCPRKRRAYAQPASDM